jgi:hypothetical protein
MHKAGTHDSGLFFCVSYEKCVVVFFGILENWAGLGTRWSSCGSGLLLQPILLIHRGLLASSKIPFAGVGKKSVFPCGRVPASVNLFVKQSRRGDL